MGIQLSEYSKSLNADLTFKEGKFGAKLIMCFDMRIWIYNYLLPFIRKGMF